MYTAVLEFVDALADLPHNDWLAIGHSLRAETDRLSALSGARAILDAIIVDRHLVPPAWYVKDAVETVAFVARHNLGRISTRDRRIFDEAHIAAEEAALALLARRYLADDDFEVLYAPFADCIPAPAADSASRT